jgi:hypothetical protein
MKILYNCFCFAALQDAEQLRAVAARRSQLHQEEPRRLPSLQSKLFELLLQESHYISRNVL